MAVSPDAAAVNPQYKPAEYRVAWLCFFLLGTINNFGYVVVLSAASSLAHAFDDDSLIGLVAWANVSFGIV